MTRYFDLRWIMVTDSYLGRLVKAHANWSEEATRWISEWEVWILP